MNHPESSSVGVIVPVLNARDELPRHLANMAEWLPKVAQVVVIDSFSEDGTLDYLRAELTHPNALFLSHPPGLYESWNHAVTALETDFFFVATLGDSLTPAGLERLHATARRFDADVVVSPPKLVDAAGRVHDKAWPLHRFIAGRGIGEACLIDGWDWLAWGLIDLPATLIGSSASNLYRTAFMQARPFPLDCGRMGDSGWALRHAFDARFAVDPQVESSFWVHAPPANIARQYARVARPIVELARQVATSRDNAPPAARRVVAAFQEIAEDLVRYHELGARYRDLRDAPGLWSDLRALLVKRERLRRRKKLQAFRRAARNLLAAG
jgi:glycosyltransferase involved in cell wall biosynthesis